MKRRPVPSATESHVLLATRRRCAICFGLNRDTSIRSGQIAHLDGDRSNHSASNLAFLCLDHHDQFDSRTSQSKNLTVSEVRAFRDELSSALAIAWSAPASFGTQLLSDEVTGRYAWSGSRATAELQLLLVSPSRARVEGFATWGRAELGAHTGELSFEADLSPQGLTYSDPEGQYHLHLRFSPGRLIASERGALGYFGLNVSFAGTYTKVA